jgi:hypothetical protein
MSWHSEEEQLVAGIGDRCNGYQWLHTQSHIHFENVNFGLTIPSIIISAVTGSVTIGLTSLFSPEYQTVATTLIGSLTLGAGVLTTVNQYMKSASLAEGHRAAALAYGKLYRTILTELSLRREERQPVKDFLKMVCAKQDRLQEMSPSISPRIIASFNKTFQGNIELERPEVAGGLEHITVPLLRSSASITEVKGPITLPMISTTEEEDQHTHPSPEN